MYGYTDSDWGSNPDDRKSYSGHLFKWGDNLLSWEVRKQKTVALSSAEAEFMGLTEATKEAIYINGLFQELKLKFTSPITIFNDNKSAQLMVSNPTINTRTKHIDIKYFFIRNAVRDKKIIYHFSN
jgi:hypothetical protein